MVSQLGCRYDRAMLKNVSIKSLYTYALAENEGVGTAYEYFAKRLVLAPWLQAQKPESMLIAGLPQKYGSSLDFLLLAEELGVVPLVVDERRAALQKLQRSLEAAKRAGALKNVYFKGLVVGEIAGLGGISAEFDLVISSEVLQRLTLAQRERYAERVEKIGRNTALFCPNKDNDAHVGISELNGLSLSELRRTAPNAQQSGYIDMPPFPPGITRTDDQREQATSGQFEAIAMKGLEVYARSEKYLPAHLRRKQSHIVYALT